jgi:AcrR family transcriptional regulator
VTPFGHAGARTGGGVALAEPLPTGVTAEERAELDAAVPVLKPRVREILVEARALVEEEGLEALSMRRLAARLGVRAPSLYKHLTDKQELLNALIAEALREQGDRMREAAEHAEDPLGALVAAYRQWALQHPGLHDLCTAHPLDDGPLVRAAALRAGDPLRRAMHDDYEGAMVLWAFVRGLCDLEMKGRMPPAFPPDIIWARGVARLRLPDDGRPEPPVVPGSIQPRPAEFGGMVVPLTARAQEIVAVARRILEERGIEAMSMREIAAELGVAAPSLYKHLPDKQALVNAMLADALREQGDLYHATMTPGEDPLITVMSVYRQWALDHPALHRLNMSAPLDRGPHVRSAELYGSVAVLDAAGGDPVAAVSIWAFGHGLVDLELKGLVPDAYELDALWARGIAALRTSLGGLSTES